MDMIGRNEEIPIGGGARFNGFEVQNSRELTTAAGMAGRQRNEKRRTNANQLRRAVCVCETLLVS